MTGQPMPGGPSIRIRSIPRFSAISLAFALTIETSLPEFSPAGEQLGKDEGISLARFRDVVVAAEGLIEGDGTCGAEKVAGPAALARKGVNNVVFEKWRRSGTPPLHLPQPVHASGSIVALRPAKNS